MANAAQLMPGQLVLNLTPLSSWDEGDFFIASCNEHAFHFVKGWPNWQSHAAIIHGPRSCGKSHLAGIWRANANARSVIAAEFTSAGGVPIEHALVVEDVNGAFTDEFALFHQLNFAKEHGLSVLLTARTPPGQWQVTLPDLRSRIRSFPAIAISEPDDELLAAVMLKHFTDRRLHLAPDVIPFILPRIERSMEAAETIVNALDRLSLSEHRKITRSFVARFLKLNESECCVESDPEKAD